MITSTQTPLSPLIRRKSPRSEVAPIMSLSSHPYEGLLIDLVHKLAVDLGFDPVFRAAAEKGHLDKKRGNWTGGLGMIISGVSMNVKDC